MCCFNKNTECKAEMEASARIQNLKQELQMDSHRISLTEIFDQYQADIANGLTHSQVTERQELYGLNCLTPPKKTPEWKKFCMQLFGGFSLLLWFGSFLCFVAYVISYMTHEEASKDNFYLGFVLAFVVISSGCFSYYQVGLVLNSNLSFGEI